MINGIFTFLYYNLFFIIQVIIGFGFMIFVHEFGHFIMAKRAGVRIEKFFLGFDFWGLKIMSVTRGDTEYGIGIFPLGGYVKMLGQEDLPTGELQTEELPDDHYLAKTTGQRAGIIAAGVTMNFISAFILSICFFYLGIEFMEPVIGGTQIDSMAWEAGFQSGDRILSIDETPVSRWEDVVHLMALGKDEGVIRKIVIDRDGIKKTIDVKTSRNILTGLISAGLIPAKSLTINGLASKGPDGKECPAMQYGLQVNDRILSWDGEPLKSWKAFELRVKNSIDKTAIVGIERDGTAQTIKLTPSRRPEEELHFTAGIRPKHSMKIIRIRDNGPASLAGIKTGDKILSINDTPIRSIQELIHFFRKNGTEPQKVTIDREGEEQTFTITPVIDPDGNRPVIAVHLDSTRFIGPIKDIESGGPVDTAGIKENDLILACNGTTLNTEYDLLKAFEDSEDKTVTLTIQHPDKSKEDIPVTLREGGEPSLPGRIWQNTNGLLRSKIYINDPFGLGAVMNNPKQAGYIVPGSPGEKAGIQTGDELYSLEYTINNKRTVMGPDQIKSWEQVDYVLKKIQLEHLAHNASAKEKLSTKPEDLQLSVMIKRDNAIQEAIILSAMDTPRNNNGWVGIEPSQLTFLVKPENFLQACSMGLKEPFIMLRKIVGVLRGLVSGKVRAKSLSGPVGIVTVTYLYAKMGFAKLVYLIAFISVNLAVINILPLPVLDGGHLLFLFIEKVRGKPVSMKVQEYIQTAGLIMILFLFLFLTYNDIRLFTSL